MKIEKKKMEMAEDEKENLRREEENSEKKNDGKDMKIKQK